MQPLDLPIHEIRPQLVEALKENQRLVLRAPPGSGKSTQVPQMLIDAGLVAEQDVIVLQPRRISARMLAQRVAQERGVRLGEEVGYQVRFENISRPETRIKYVTEGILLRRLMEDPNLIGTGAVIFDEFHERNLYSDISMAQILRIQAERKRSLLILVMSATLDEGQISRYLAPCASFSSDGRTFPVEIAYSEASESVSKKPIWEQAGFHFRRLVERFPVGDFLIFMPGAFEINRTIEELQLGLRARDFIFLPLYGDLPPERQDAALDHFEKRKVVVATNVAETSLTIDGIRIVIDCGLARIPAFDPNRGINTLLVQKISQAAAEQRAGRAGRTGPGYCLRMWGEKDHALRPVRERPEIHRLELAEIALTLLASGVENLAEFPWFEAPDKKIMDRALQLLGNLGALEPGQQKLTEIGQRMALFPLHPRLSRLFLAAHQSGCLRPITLIAAFTQVRAFLLPLDDKRRAAERDELLGDEMTSKSDFFLLLRAWDLARSHNFASGFCRKWGIHGNAARKVGQIMQQFLRIAKAQGLKDCEKPFCAEDIQRCLVVGFSDHLAKRIDRGSLRCNLIGGRKAEVRRQSVVRKSPLLVSAEIEERDVRGEVTVLLGLNTEVQEEWIRELSPKSFVEDEKIFFDQKLRRVLKTRVRLFKDLLLESSEDSDPSPDEAARILGEEVLHRRLKLKKWNEKVESWINRINFAARHFPESEIPSINTDERKLLLEQICYGAFSYREIKDREVWPILNDWLIEEQHDLLQSLVPERVFLRECTSCRVRYDDEGRAFLRATIEQLYDAPKRVALGEGKVPLLIEVLAPNATIIQVTSNLEKFWSHTYPQIRKELQGRFPRHEWR